MIQDVAIEDWDALFEAVLERLRASVENCKAVAPLERRAHWGHARSSVLECVEALDQLHHAATHEFARHPLDVPESRPCHPAQAATRVRSPAPG